MDKHYYTGHYTLKLQSTTYKEKKTFEGATKHEAYEKARLYTRDLMVRQVMVKGRYFTSDKEGNSLI